MYNCFGTHHVDEKPDLKIIYRLEFLNWRGVGLQLGMKSHCLDVIERNHPKDLNRQKEEMLSTWLREDTNATYGRLAEALLAVGEAACAEQVAKNIGQCSVC